MAGDGGGRGRGGCDDAGEGGGGVAAAPPLADVLANCGGAEEVAEDCSVRVEPMD